MTNQEKLELVLGVSGEKKVSQEMGKLIKETTKLGKHVKTVTQEFLLQDKSIKKVTQSFARLDGAIVKTKAHTIGTGKAVKKIATEYYKAGEKIKETSQHIREANYGFLGTKDYISKIMAKVTTWGIATGILYGTVRTLKKGIDTITEFDSSLVDLKKVFRGTSQELRLLRGDILDTSVAMGSLTGDTMQAAIALGRMGKTRAEIAELTRVSLLAQNIAEIEAVDATKLLNAAILQFEQTADDALEILDKWNELSNRTPVTTRDLATAMSNAGAVFHQAGGNIEDLNAIVAVLTATMAKSGDEIGQALKTISSYAYRQETVRKITKLTGIAVKDQMGNLMDIDELLARLAAKWHMLSEAEQEELAQTVAGVRRKGYFLNLMENFDMVLENQIKQWYAAGSAIRENEIRLGSLATKVTQLQAALEKLAIQGGDTSGLLSILKVMVDQLRIFVDNLSEAHASLQLFSALLAGGAAYGVLRMASAIKILNVAFFKWTAILTAAVGVFNVVTWIFSAQERTIKRYNQALREQMENLRSLQSEQESLIEMSQTLNALFSEYTDLLARGENEAAAKTLENIKKALEGIEELDPGLIDTTDSIATSISNIGSAAETAKRNILALRQSMLQIKLDKVNAELEKMTGGFRPDQLSITGPSADKYFRLLEEKKRLESLIIPVGKSPEEINTWMREHPLFAPPPEREPSSTPAEQIDEKAQELLDKETQRHELAMARIISEDEYLKVLLGIIADTDDLLEQQKLINRYLELEAQIKKKSADQDKRDIDAAERKIRQLYNRIGLQLGRSISDSMVLSVTDGATRLDKLQVWNRVGQNIGDMLGAYAAEKFVKKMALEGAIASIATGSISGLISGGIAMLSQWLFPVEDPIREEVEAVQENTRSIRELTGTIRDFNEQYIRAPASFLMGATTGEIPQMAGGGKVLRSGIAYIHAGEEVRRPEYNTPYMSQNTYNNQRSIQIASGAIQVFAQPGQNEDAIATKVVKKIIRSYNRGDEYGNPV